MRGTDGLSEGKCVRPDVQKTFKIMPRLRSCHAGPNLVRKLVWVPLVHRLGREQERVVLSHLAWGAGS